MKFMRHKWMWLLIGLSVAVAAAFAYALVAASQDPSSRERGFNSAAWRAGDECLRGRMVKDLRDSAILTGRTPSEVIELLGPPEYQSEKDGKPSKFNWTIDVGSRFCFGPWTNTLFVCFDESSTEVTEVYWMD